MRRLRAVGAHLSATSASDDELLFMRFPHCGEVRQVHPIPQELLDRSLGPGHGTVTVGDRIGGAFALRGPSVVAETEEEQPTPEAAPDAPLRVDGPLALQPPATGEAVGDLARRLEDDGLLYLPGALTPEQVASLIQAMDAAKTDPGNPVDSGIGTLAANRAIAAAEAAGEAPDWNWTGNKGVMSWWNRFPDGQMLQYLDLDPCCAVAEATLGADCHLIQQKGWTTGPGRPADRQLHLDFLPLYCPGAQAALLEGRLRVPIALITAHYYLEDTDMDLGPTLFVPGSHLSGRAPRAGEHSWRGKGARAALVNAGDCLMFRSDVWHASTPNLTADRTRHIMQVHYCSSLLSHRVGSAYQPRSNEGDWHSSHDGGDGPWGSPVASPESEPAIEKKMNARQARRRAGFGTARAVGAVI